MIERIYEDKRADECDKILTKLIRDEKRFNNYIDEKYVVKDYFKNIIKNYNNVLLGYIKDDKVIGYIFLKEVYADDRKGYLIDGLYVIRKYRNQGIGNALFEEAMYYLKFVKPDFVDVNVMAGNLNAIKIYKKHGFVDFKISMRKIFDK